MYDGFLAALYHLRQHVWSRCCTLVPFYYLTGSAFSSLSVHLYSCTLLCICFYLLRWLTIVDNMDLVCTLSLLSSCTVISVVIGQKFCGSERLTKVEGDAKRISVSLVMHVAHQDLVKVLAWHVNAAACVLMILKALSDGKSLPPDGYKLIETNHNVSAR